MVVDEEVSVQRFVDEFRRYEEKLFCNAEKDMFTRLPQTVAQVYFQVVETLCSHIVSSMFQFGTAEQNDANMAVIQIILCCCILHLFCLLVNRPERFC